MIYSSKLLTLQLHLDKYVSDMHLHKEVSTQLLKLISEQLTTKSMICNCSYKMWYLVIQSLNEHHWNRKVTAVSWYNIDGN